MLKAQILLSDETQPIQIQMTAEEALSLVYIANDFAISVERTSPETVRLSDFAGILSAKLQDCLVAKTAMPTPPVLAMRPVPEPEQTQDADAA